MSRRTSRPKKAERVALELRESSWIDGIGGAQGHRPSAERHRLRRGVSANQMLTCRSALFGAFSSTRSTRNRCGSIRSPDSYVVSRGQDISTS